MKSLKIAMLTTFYPPYSFGGDAVGVQRLARALVRKGHEVTVIHDADAYLALGGKVGADGPADDDPRIVTLEGKPKLLSALLTQQLGRPVMHGPQIRQVLRDGDFDIVWYNNVSLVGGPGLLQMGRGLKVYEAHEHWLVCPMHVLWRYNKELCDKKDCLRCTLSFRRPPQLWRATGLLEKQARHVDLFIAKSEFSRAKHAEFGFKPDMQVVPYFLPDIEGPAETAEHPRPYFLFVGRLEKIKGLQDVFPAFQKDRGADLLILGDGEYRAELERMAGGSPFIKFLGRKPLDALNAYYRGALGLVVPSICYETFGIILIESFRLGTPVVARRLGPFPEIVERANGGVLFETEAELTSALDALQHNPAARSAQSAAARQAFETIWQEAPVLAAYGASLAKAAHTKGSLDLAKALDAGAFENGAGQV